MPIDPVAEEEIRLMEFRFKRLAYEFDKLTARNNELWDMLCAANAKAASLVYDLHEAKGTRTIGNGKFRSRKKKET